MYDLLNLHYSFDIFVKVVLKISCNFGPYFCYLNKLVWIDIQKNKLGEKFFKWIENDSDDFVWGERNAYPLGDTINENYRI